MPYPTPQARPLFYQSQMVMSRLTTILLTWVITYFKLIFCIIGLPVIYWARRRSYLASPRARLLRKISRKSTRQDINDVKAAYFRVARQVKAFGPHYPNDILLSPVVPISSVLSILRTPSDRFEEVEDEFAKLSRFMVLKNGLRIHYYELGDGARNTVVFLHNSQTWSAVWRPVLNLMAGRECRVLALDFPGHGKSDKSTAAEDTSVMHCCYALNEFTAATNQGGTTSVVCHGSAGYITLRAMCEYPGLQRIIDRLVLVQTLLPIYREINDIPLLVHQLFVHGWQSIMGYRMAPYPILLPSQEKQVYELPYFNTNSRSVFANPVLPLPGEEDSEDVKMQLYAFSSRKRVWVVWGGRDWWVPDRMRYLMELCECPGMRMERSGHYPMQDDPEDFADHLCEYFGIEPEMDFQSSASTRSR